MERKIHVPPIKIQGIKTKLVPWILEQLTVNIEGRWIEPFMGSGVVGFNVRPKQAVFADKNPHIINFYNAIKNGNITAYSVKEYLHEQGRLLSEKGEVYYYEVRERFNKYHDPLDFLFLNRSCFNGMVRFNRRGEFNTPFGKKPYRFSKAYITKIVNQVKYIEKMLQINDWVFVCQDYRDVLQEARKEDFIYCDPPYFGRNTNYYDLWKEEDEKELYLLLSKHKGYFMLSSWYGNKYRKNKFINELWRKFTIVTKNHFYHLGAKESNRNAMTEALIMNFQPAEEKKEIKMVRQLSLAVF